MTLKIATLTFHTAINYGAVLQAYALQNAIVKLGYDSEVIDYTCDAIARNYSQSKSNAKDIVKGIINKRVLETRLARFEEFINNRIKTSGPVSSDGLCRLSRRYDGVIVGSDQVWNTKLTGCDGAYLLDFVEPEKRMAYAASMGISRWELKEEEEIAGHLAQFSQITVRETTSADYIETLIGKRPKVVCDPVFLLTESEWSGIAGERLIEEGYALLFCLGSLPAECVRWARREARKNKIQLALVYLGNIPVFGMEDYRDAGPIEFLNLVKHAEFVVTPSFHGCCFSILFNKSFYWFNSSKTDAGKCGTSSRQRDLLRMFGLSSREIGPDSAATRNIEYGDINSKIEKYRSDSLKELADMLAQLSGGACKESRRDA